jgi:hypothetical protein
LPFQLLKLAADNDRTPAKQLLGFAFVQTQLARRICTHDFQLRVFRDLAVE